MRPPQRNQPPALIVIAVAILFILLAVLEAMAGDLNSPGGDPGAPWTVHIRHADDALAKGDLSAADRAWHDAYAAALGSRRWEGMVEVGDALRRLGAMGGSRTAADARARRIYLTALFRARQEGSLDGVLRAAEAFSALGDPQVVAQAIRIADRLATQRRDAQARERVHEFSQRLAINYP